jgi:hypothetical protein
MMAACIADFQSAGHEIFRALQYSKGTQAGSPAIQQLGNLRYARAALNRWRLFFGQTFLGS